MSNIQDSLRDIVKHTHGIGIFESVKIIGTDTEAKIETIDSEKTVVMTGKMYQSITDVNSIVGMSRLPVMKGYMDLHVDSTVTVTKEDRGGVMTPVEVNFDNGAGLVANYRFMSEAITNEQIKVPPFRGATWNVSVKPEKKSVATLAAYQGILGAFEKRFTVKTSKNKLFFVIGSGPSDRVELPFAEGITGSLSKQWSYPLSQVLSILRLSDTSAAVMLNFSDMGAMMIEIDSGIGKYSYVIPAKQS